MSEFRKRISMGMMAVALGLAQALPGQTQEGADAESAAAAELVQRAAETIATLQPLLDTRRSLATRIDELADRADAVGDAEKERLDVELEGLAEELGDVEEQISIIVTGVSEREYQALDDVEFDLQTEIENLVEPFLSLLIGATESARQIERARRDLVIAEQRLENAERAMANIDAAIAAAADTAVIENLREKEATWSDRVEIQAAQITALNQQIETLDAQRLANRGQVDTAFTSFFQDRGLSLLLGVGAFTLFFTVGRVISYVMGRVVAARRKSRSFLIRLGSLVFSAFTLLGSFAAMIVVFNLRNDWLLLGLATLLLIAIVWVLIRMLPNLIEQLTVLLNLGAVQEDERVVFNDVPFKVQRLGMYTDLVNPALDGGEFTLPVRELVGLHSRPAAENEAWFPSKKGDWVRLADGNAGQVVAQTPEMVVLQLLGGAQVTYQTADYLAQTPENLSQGYRVEVEFGIGYRHQPEATDTIIRQMQQGVEQRMQEMLGPDLVRAVEVEFLRAGASSLDYEVEVDVTGAAAPRFEEIERELARTLVSVATKHGWEIPFQQIVLHTRQAA